jgi:hypothetical protein
MADLVNRPVHISHTLLGSCALSILLAVKDAWQDNGTIPGWDQKQALLMSYVANP